MNMVELAEAED